MRQEKRSQLQEQLPTPNAQPVRLENTRIMHRLPARVVKQVATAPPHPPSLPPHVFRVKEERRARLLERRPIAHVRAVSVESTLLRLA